MKHILLIICLLAISASCNTNRPILKSHSTIDRYLYITETQIPLYEFPSLKGGSVLSTEIGDTISTTGVKPSQIGGEIPVEYKGYRFYSPLSKAHFIGAIKIDPERDDISPGITYLPRKKIKDQEAVQLAYERQRAEDLKIDWYGQVTYQAPLLEIPSSLGKTMETIPANTVLKIEWHDESFWKVSYNGKVGYIHMYRVAYFSRSKDPFVRTEYNGSFGEEDGNQRTNTPTTGAYIHTGPRGGRYYINSNGNKTYVPRNGNGSYRSSGGRSKY